MTKLIQTFSTDTVFSKKEDFMIPFNDFRTEFVELMREYCIRLADVPEPQIYYAVRT